MAASATHAQILLATHHPTAATAKPVFVSMEAATMNPFREAAMTAMPVPSLTHVKMEVAPASQLHALRLLLQNAPLQPA